MRYLTPQEHLRRLKLKKVKKGVKITTAAILTAAAINILYICSTSGNDTKKMNICLQDHTLNYCNKEVK